MRWRGNRRSSNVEDRRATRASGTGNLGGGALQLLPVVFKFLGFKGTALLAIGVVGYALVTGNVNTLLGVLGLQQSSPTTTSSQPLKQTNQEIELVDFVSVILADTEDTWRVLFKNRGKTYKEPKLVLFRDAVKSACGLAKSATGPFYCPADQKVYIDLGFYDQLKNRFKAPGDFAQAYVIAHEVGHHIQTLLGISKEVHQARQKLSKTAGNKLSVKQELQADCLAGVWANHAHHSRQLLEQGDIEEGLRAASAIGDDTLQKQSQGYVTPDSFTHGSSKDRVKWFKIGLSGGNLDDCDTFKKALSTTLLENPLVTSFNSESTGTLADAYKNRKSNVQVQGKGTVKRILADDNEGSRHQKFILSLPNGQTVLVAHNVDLAPRVQNLKTGDQIKFNGEYEWNRQGGVLHWTHDDPNRRHENGWIEHNGRKFH